MSDARAAAEAAVLDVLRLFRGRATGPSRREIADATGLGLGSVQLIVTSLAEAGKIDYDQHIARSIRIKEEA